ncbi:hypothetical protein JZ751_015234 [Albula glossodonta]|uniref:G-protein coupled receptors family 1 profile domain-containing protein n=1 Tax=Albula glossodonta TaxID=121402 RepID=A0A8T2NU27_9TELE|nr:hypothetical protein JZ751_015234 [Albula glossodonta]
MEMDVLTWRKELAGGEADGALQCQLNGVNDDEHQANSSVLSLDNTSSPAPLAEPSGSFNEMFITSDWYFGDIGCRILFSLDFLTMHASIFILTIMSTERYLAVVNPLDSFGRSRHYRRTVTCVVWLASFFLALPTMIMIDLKIHVKNGEEKRMCHPTWQIQAYKVYLTVLFNTCILAPGIIIGYLYISHQFSDTVTITHLKGITGGTSV